MMQNRSLNILFLPRWYPNRFDPMPGLFIQRQAEALAGSNQVVVVYVHPDPDCPGDFEIDYAEEKRVTVIRVYFNIPEFTLPGLYPLHYALNFYRAHQRARAMFGDFRPDIIHSHILTRIAFIGYLWSRKYRVPHVISEHWSRYFPANNTYRGCLRKWMTRFLVRNADGIIVVSEKLKEAMQSHKLFHPSCFTVPNIADTRLFIPIREERSHPLKQFIHVSCFDDRAKNISGLLQAVKALHERRSDFRCLLVGVGPDLKALEQLAAKLELTGKSVFFTGLKEGKELADLYRRSDFTVLPSRYETFGTVIVESLACGTPVLSAPVGIAPEILDHTNGMLVHEEGASTWANALDYMLDHSHSFDRQAVRASVEGRFTAEQAGSQLVEIYTKLRGDV